jgi:hypothetical protein
VVHGQQAELLVDDPSTPVASSCLANASATRQKPGAPQMSGVGPGEHGDGEALDVVAARQDHRGQAEPLGALFQPVGHGGRKTLAIVLDDGQAPPTVAVVRLASPSAQAIARYLVHTRRRPNPSRILSPSRRLHTQLPNGFTLKPDHRGRCHHGRCGGGPRCRAERPEGPRPSRGRDDCDRRRRGSRQSASPPKGGPVREVLKRSGSQRPGWPFAAVGKTGESRCS